MTALRAAGLPVPHVFEAHDTDLVMEKVEGRSMLDELAARPWAARVLGRRVGELHHQLLHLDVAPPADLPSVADGQRVLHLDFHPGNVMVHRQRLTIIDWTNAAVGPAGLDIATTWMLMATSTIDDVPRAIRPIAGFLRNVFLRSYLRAANAGHEAEPWMRLACERRLVDPGTRPEEAERVRAFAARATFAVEPRSQ